MSVREAPLEPSEHGLLPAISGEALLIVEWSSDDRSESPGVPIASSIRARSNSPRESAACVVGSPTISL